MAIQELLNSLIDRLQQCTSVKLVYGEPIETHEKTIIPVARVAAGFGGGTGQRRLEHQDHLEKGHEGSGGGGGFRATPAGVLEITAAETRFIPIHSTRTLALAVAGGFVLGLLLRRK